ncbi:metallophosphoesterase [Candidatus Daviesbacteria bacterium]|nr:metallophosphoesterase [Candidatus Daviesbacteria bacterium]
MAAYQAYRYFSGVDPLKTSPKAILGQMFTSEGVAELVNSILTFKLPKNLADFGQIGLSTSSPGGSKAVRQGVPVLYKFAIVTDSHNDNDHLAKALKQAQEAGARFIIGLGDYTNVGTLDELQKAKSQFVNSGLPYFITVGDHDLWDCRNRNLTPSCNFTTTFGPTYQSFSDSGVRFVLGDNSDNYLGIDGVQMKWLEDELIRVKNDKPKQAFLFVSTPLFHPSSDHVMGKDNPKLKDQASHIISIAKDAGVGEVFAGDTHFFTRYVEPKSELKMTTVGAVVQDRNAQAPRFAVITLYQDGGYDVEDVEIK